MNIERTSMCALSTAGRRITAYFEIYLTIGGPKEIRNP